MNFFTLSFKAVCTEFQTESKHSASFNKKRGQNLSPGTKSEFEPKIKFNLNGFQAIQGWNFKLIEKPTDLKLL